jgi:hypothetical protein
MLYATLEEAYNIPSFKKPKKKKTKEVELSPEIDPYDKFDSSMIVSKDHSRITNTNQCDPLQAPPYVFPIEEKAKKQYEQALNVMNVIDTKVESNIDDELDAYLNEEEYKEFNNIPIKTVKTVKTDKTYKTNKNAKSTKNNKTNKQFDRIYELIILVLLALLITLMCEAIVRIAKS